MLARVWVSVRLAVGVGVGGTRACASVRAQGGLRLCLRLHLPWWVSAHLRGQGRRSHPPPVPGSLAPSHAPVPTPPPHPRSLEKRLPLSRVPLPSASSDVSASSPDLGEPHRGMWRAEGVG